MSLIHVKSNTIGDFTGTVTVNNSAGATQTAAASDLIRPADWNSAHQFNQTISGNTSGDASTASGTNLVFGFSGGIQGSMSTAAEAATLWIQQPVVTDGWNAYRDLALVTAVQGQGSLQFDPEHLHEPVQFDRLAFGVFNTNSSNSSGSHTLSFWAGFYTRNGSTLSLLASTSTSTALTHSGTAGSYSLYSGMRLMTIPMTTTLTQGNYVFAFLSRTTSGGANGSYSNIAGSAIASNFLGHFGSSHATTVQFTLGQGQYSATTSGLPASVAYSQIVGSNSAARRPTILMMASGTV